MVAIPSDEVANYLRTGNHDLTFRRWPGDTFVSSATLGKETLARALVQAVREREAAVDARAVIPVVDASAFVYAKVEPMVRGLFPRQEQEVVLDRLASSVVFLTSVNIATILTQARWLHTAWDLANLYLGSIGARLLAKEAPRIVGLSEETTCYVSADYFATQDGFSEFIVHEAAHVFHNCKRRTIGLPETRTKEWLLDIAFRKRETFAYACEALSRILERGRTRPERRALLTELGQRSMPNDETVDPAEYMDILRGAIEARNGWKFILARCPPERVRRPRVTG